MKQHNGTTYENVWGVTFGDRLEEAREEARAEGKAAGQERAGHEVPSRLLILRTDINAN